MLINYKEQSYNYILGMSSHFTEKIMFSWVHRESEGLEKN